MMGFFKDDSGALSMMRLTQLLVVVVILFVFIMINGPVVINAIKHGASPAAIIDFPQNCVAMLALVIGGKVVQSIFAEKPVSGDGSAAPHV